MLENWRSTRNGRESSGKKDSHNTCDYRIGEMALPQGLRFATFVSRMSIYNIDQWYLFILLLGAGVAYTGEYAKVRNAVCPFMT